MTVVRDAFLDAEALADRPAHWPSLGSASDDERGHTAVGRMIIPGTCAEVAVAVAFKGSGSYCHPTVSAWMT